MSIDAAKKRVSGAFLGKQGIHAVGARRSEGAVCVYVVPQQLPAVEAMRPEIEALAQGHKVLILADAPASLLSA